MCESIARISQCAVMGRAQPERNVEREKPGRAGPEEAFTIERSLPHGHVEAVLAMTRRLGLDRLIAPKRSPERDRVLAMVVGRLLHPGSKLATARRWHTTTLVQELDLGDDEDDEDDPDDPDASRARPPGAPARRSTRHGPGTRHGSGTRRAGSSHGTSLPPSPIGGWPGTSGGRSTTGAWSMNGTTRGSTPRRASMSMNGTTRGPTPRRASTASTCCAPASPYVLRTGEPVRASHRRAHTCCAPASPYVLRTGEPIRAAHRRAHTCCAPASPYVLRTGEPVRAAHRRARTCFAPASPPGGSPPKTRCAPARGWPTPNAGSAR